MNNFMDQAVALIVQHASTGPAETKGQRVANRLSPHFEKLTKEVIRGLLIKMTQQAQDEVAQHLFKFRSQLTFDDQKHNFAFMTAQINARLQDIYK